MAKIPLEISMQLHFLRDFSSQIESNVARAWSEIEEGNENGEFADFGAYESAMDYPLFRSDYGGRAVMNELNAMVEGALQGLAQPFWRNRQNSAQVKTIHDLPFWAVVQLVEEKYGVKVNELEGAEEFELLRKMVNAFKHRKGFRKFQDMEQNPETGGIEMQYKASLEKAGQFLETIPKFLGSLYALKVKRLVDA